MLLYFIIPFAGHNFFVVFFCQLRNIFRTCVQLPFTVFLYSPFPDNYAFLSLSPSQIKNIQSADTVPVHGHSPLVEKICCPISTLIDYGPHGVRTIVSQSRNQFWKEVFEIWDHIYNALSIKTQYNLLSPLWCNSKVKRGLLKDQWYKNGITLVGDLVNCNTLKMKSKTEIEDVYNFKIKNFLDYYEVRGAIKKLMGETEHQREFPERPWIPNHLSFLIKQKKGCKNIYNILNSKSCDNKYRDQWNHELNTIIDNINWKRIFFICFNTVLDNKLIWFQYKLIYRILETQAFVPLIRQGKDNNPLLLSGLRTVSV